MDIICSNTVTREGNSMAHRSWQIRSGEDFGRAIADIRESKGLTQRELSARAGIARSYLAQIEAGRTVRLLDHVLRLLRRLGAEVTVTFSDSPDQERRSR